MFLVLTIVVNYFVVIPRMNYLSISIDYSIIIVSIIIDTLTGLLFVLSITHKHDIHLLMSETYHKR